MYGLLNIWFTELYSTREHVCDVVCGLFVEVWATSCRRRAGRAGRGRRRTSCGGPAGQSPAGTAGAGSPAWRGTHWSENKVGGRGGVGLNVFHSVYNRLSVTAPKSWPKAQK